MKKHKLIICITVMMLALTLGGCGDAKTHRTESEIRGDREVIYEDAIYNVSTFKDPYTNVEYIIVNSGYGTCIVPRLNPDGSLCIGE